MQLGLQWDFLQELRACADSGGRFESTTAKRYQGQFSFIFLSIDYQEKMNTLWRFLLIPALGVWQGCWV